MAIYTEEMTDLLKAEAERLIAELDAEPSDKDMRMLITSMMRVGLRMANSTHDIKARFDAITDVIGTAYTANVIEKIERKLSAPKPESP